MASRSPGNENNLIYINFDVSTMVYCLHQENPGKISFLEKLQILFKKPMSYNAWCVATIFVNEHKKCLKNSSKT